MPRRSIRNTQSLKTNMGTGGDVKLTLTNEKTASGLALTARGYIVEATYPKGDGTNLTASLGLLR